MRKRGRPRAIIDEGVVFHMIKNYGSIKAIAEHFGVCRDTILANFGDTIREVRRAGQKESMKYGSKRVALFLEERKRKKEARQLEKRL